MDKQSFKNIRIAAWEKWQKDLNRRRGPDELTDDYSESLVCEWQEKCKEEMGLHCSFYCSLGDWLNNISDELTDSRFDALGPEDGDILFRYYTRVLKLASEIVEDFVVLHSRVSGIIGKKKAGSELFADNELGELSDFINSVTKHKTEGKNLHVCNHHLYIEFEDFGAKHGGNQIRLENLCWDTVDNETTILMPSLGYLISIISRLHIKLGQLLDDQNYKDRVYEIYAGPFEFDDE